MNENKTRAYETNSQGIVTGQSHPSELSSTSWSWSLDLQFELSTLAPRFVWEGGLEDFWMPSGIEPRADER